MLKLRLLPNHIIKVLPTTYDDSLSYYEVLCKLIDKINEVIEWIDKEKTFIANVELEGDEDYLESVQVGEEKFKVYTGEDAVKQSELSSVLYGTNGSGEQSAIAYSSASGNNTIVQRDNNGRIKCASPSANSDCATKQYVDNAVKHYYQHNIRVYFADASKAFYVAFSIVSNDDTPFTLATLKTYLGTKTVACTGYRRVVGTSETDMFTRVGSSGGENDLSFYGYIVGTTTSVSPSETITNFSDEVI